MHIHEDYITISTGFPNGYVNSLPLSGCDPKIQIHLHIRKNTTLLPYINGAMLMWQVEQEVLNMLETLVKYTHSGGREVNSVMNQGPIALVNF